MATSVENKAVPTSEQQAAEDQPEKKKAFRPRPNWAYWKKYERLSLKEAVSLSFNLSPGKIDAALKRVSSLRGPFAKRLKLANYQTLQGGQLAVVQHGNSTDGNDTIVEVRSFVRFAIAMKWKNVPQEFLTLGDELAEILPDEESPKEKPAKIVAPESVIPHIIKLLVDLATRMAKIEGVEPLSIDKVPGPKKDLYQVAIGMNDKYAPTFNTFDKYLSGLCKVQPGRPTERLIRQLYPEYFKD